MQDEFESFIMVANVQALTDNWEHPEKIRDAMFEVVADNIASGIDPNKSTIFLQSRIPEIAELTVFFSNLVTVNELRRNPIIKNEIAQKKQLFGNEGESLTYGFLGYPVSQSADILFCRANVVPVGEDQLPVIELVREVAIKFNKIYENVFPVPEAKLSKAPRILGLDGNAKMSKSLGNAIYLKDSPEEIREKLKIAKTDSESQISYDPEKRPEISNLVLIYSLIHNISTKESVKDLGNINYSAFKEKLASDLADFLSLIREKRGEITSNQNYIKEVLDEGHKKASASAQETLKLVKEAMKINY